MRLNIKGDTVDRQLSEASSVATSSAVAGTVDASGVVGLHFKGINNDHLSGRADDAIKGNTISLVIRTTTAKACSYQFELSRVPLVAMAPNQECDADQSQTVSATPWKGSRGVRYALLSLVGTTSGGVVNSGCAQRSASQPLDCSRMAGGCPDLIEQIGLPSLSL